MSITDSDLAQTIRAEVEYVDKGYIPACKAAAQTFRDLGIVSDMHVGIPQGEFTPRMTLEWYAGALIGIVDREAWYAVNSWINCCDKFTTLI